MKALILLLMVLAGCGQQEPSKVQPPARSSSYTVLSTNEKTIQRFNLQVDEAKKHLAAIREELKKSDRVLVDYRSRGLSPSIPKQSKRFLEMGTEGKSIFGDSPLDQPFGRCGALGDDAWNYWMAVISGKKHDVDFGVKFIKESISECEYQINNPPEAVAQIRVAPPVEKPPFDGCLAVLDLSTAEQKPTEEWSCPLDIVKKGI